MVFATVNDNATTLGNPTNAKAGYNDAPVVTATAFKAERREPADDSSQDSGYDDFLAFLSSPNPQKKVIDNVAPVVAVPVVTSNPVPEPAPKESSAPVTTSLWSTAAKNASTRKAAPTYVETLSTNAAPVKAVPAKEENVDDSYERKQTVSTVASSFAGSVPDATEDVQEDVSLSSEEESSVSEWSSGEDETEAEDEQQPVADAAFVAAAPTPAPMMKAKSLGRGSLSSNDLSVESLEETRDEAPADETAIAKPAPKPRYIRPEEPEWTLPKSASVATLHFANEEVRKGEEIEAAREQTRAKDPVEPLPIDHFTKLGDAQMAAKAEESRKLAESVVPVAIKYFTELAEVEKQKAYAEQRALSDAEMSAATRHFKKLAEEEAANPATGEADIMPAAIQHFTLEARAEKEKKRAEIAKSVQEPAPAAIEFFTSQERAEKARKAAEIEELKNNPPPASVATEYFKVKEEEKQVEIERMMNEPAPAAIEYFTQKDRMEKEKSRRALELADSQPYEPAAATKYFADLEEKKAAEIEANRERTRELMKQSSNRPQIDWANLTKQTAPKVSVYYAAE